MGTVNVDRQGAVAVVTLRRPPANAMDIALVLGIAEVFERLGEDQSARAAVLTGDGPSFCAGLDLKAVPGFGEADQRRLLDALNRCFFAVYDCPLPVVGAINGHAIAGGLVLALCCDWRIAAKAPFWAGLPEVRAGIPYPVAAIEVVRHELSARVSRELVLFGQNLAQEHAVAAGVFDEAAGKDSLLEHAIRKAKVLTELPRTTFGKIKRQLRRDPRDKILAALAGQEPLYGDWLSEETLAGAAVLLGKR